MTSDTAAPANEIPAGTPTVVVDDVHVVYKVISEGPATRRSRQGRVPPSKSVHALKGLSFVARSGESIGIIGKNGSGKSTLLRTIAGLRRPSQGRVYAHGQPTLLGVNAALLPGLSGARNVRLGGLALGLTPKDVDARFDEVVDFAGIRPFIDYPMRTYSSGMSARLRFAIAIVNTPPVLLIDEALATGDADFRERSGQKIEELRAQAGTVFLVSHSSRTIEETCDRAIWLHDGEMLADGPSADVVEEYRRFVESRRKAAQ